MNSQLEGGPFSTYWVAALWLFAFPRQLHFLVINLSLLPDVCLLSLLSHHNSTAAQVHHTYVPAT